MALREKLSEQMKEAMKAKAVKRLSAIRLILAAIQEREIAARVNALPEEDMLGVLAKMIKQREESAETYDRGGRPELADVERDEIVVIREFMPQQLGAEETRAAVAKAIADTGAASIKDMGKVMGALKGAYAGQMDFGKAGQVVEDLLSSPK